MAAKRPAYSQPSIMPRKQWVVVKSERLEDDDLIVVSGEEEEGEEEEEEEGEEEEEEERELELLRERDRTDFSISNVRSLSGELGGRPESDMDSQVSPGGKRCRHRYIISPGAKSLRPEVTSIRRLHRDKPLNRELV